MDRKGAATYRGDGSNLPTSFPFWVSVMGTAATLCVVLSSIMLNLGLPMVFVLLIVAAASVIGSNTIMESTVPSTHF